MRYLVVVIATALLLTESGLSQSTAQNTAKPGLPDPTGWSRLQTLNPDSEISVSSDYHRAVRCQGIHISAEGLSCEFRSSFFGTRVYDFPRAEVESVRLCHTRRNLRIGIGAAGAAGFVAGVLAPGGGKAGERFITGVAAGALTGLASAILVYPTVQLLPGETIYRRQPDGSPNSKAGNP